MIFFKSYGGTHLFFPSLITELHRLGGIKEYNRDTWVRPITLIYSLKIRGEGAPGKSKKRKSDLGKSNFEDPKYCKPYIVGPFEKIGIYLRAIRVLFLGLPQGSGDPSTTRHSYMARFDYESDDEAPVKWSKPDYAGDDVESEAQTAMPTEYHVFGTHTILLQSASHSTGVTHQLALASLFSSVSTRGTVLAPFQLGLQVGSQSVQRGSCQLDDYLPQSQFQSQFRIQFSSTELGLSDTVTQHHAPVPKFRNDSQDRAPSSKSQGSGKGVHTRPFSEECGKNHLGVCRSGSDVCFRYGKLGHRKWECRVMVHSGKYLCQQGQSNRSVAQSGCPNQQGATSSATTGQCPNRLYALQSREDQESSLDVVTLCSVSMTYAILLMSAKVRFCHVYPYSTSLDKSRMLISIPQALVKYQVWYSAIHTSGPHVLTFSELSLLNDVVMSSCLVWRE
ncbi:hypothetical protein FXO37_33401 [Capsicum annuum]|nr:hypothetical protein FXO37_33401 [Capsicum annuum]